MPGEVRIDFDPSLSADERADIDREALSELLGRLLRDEGRAAVNLTLLTVLLTDEERLRELNREFRGRDEPTDVLSFAAGDEATPASDDLDYLGDVAIAVPIARRQASEAALPLQTELAHLATHATLHLLGYDHEGAGEAAEMVAREEALLGAEIHARTSEHDDQP